MSDNWKSSRVDRRTFVKRSAGLAISLGGVAGLLGACAPASAPAPTSVPTSGPGPTQAPAVKIAAPTAPAAAPTAKAAAPTAPAAAIKRGGILTNVASAAIESYDRHSQSSMSDAEGALIYDTLLRRALVDPVKETFETRPALAESYTVVDPTTVEFKLRRGVKFHDGSDFNAAVVAWNIERAASHPKSRLKTLVGPVRETKVVDDYTLRLLLKKPSGTLPLNLSDGADPVFGMVSKEAVEKMGDEKFGLNPVGTGPMKFKEWVKDDRLVLEKFPGHWEKGADGQPLPYLDGGVFRFMLDSAAIMLELKSGNVHSVQPRDVADVPAVQADPNLVFTPQPGVWLSYPGMYINPRPESRSPFSKDKRLREAAAFAIDHQTMAKALGQGMGKPAYYPFWFPGMPGYDETLPRREFNLARAKQLLAEAGYANGIDVEARVINRPGDVQPLEVLQAMWAAAGIRLKIAQVDRLVWIEDGRTGKFEILAHGFVQRPEAVVSPYTWTGASGNWSGYSNPAVDKLYEAAEVEYDEAKRAEIYKKMQQIHYDDAYFLSGFMIPRPIYHNKRVRGMSTYWLYRHLWMS